MYANIVNNMGGISHHRSKHNLFRADKNTSVSGVRPTR